MFMKRSNFVLLVAAISLLTSCAAPGQLATEGEGAVGPYPNDWKNISTDFIRSNYVDPYSIRDSVAAPPFRNKKAFFDSWTICLRNNAKNRMGGYTGLSYTALHIQKGAIVVVDPDGAFDCANPNLKYEPLPI